MEKYVLSSDGIRIHYKESGRGNFTIVFIHGWLGNADWWKDQQCFLVEEYHIVQIDLGGHGKSDKTRANWSATQYADDILAVINEISASEIILVGHSMSGAYVFEACKACPKVKAIILVDTLKNLDEDFTAAQAEDFMFSHFRKNFRSSVENMLPQYLFVANTPEDVKRRLQSEFLRNDSEFAINALRPLYEMDVRKVASQTDLPVRAINSDATPTNAEGNRKYFKDYDSRIIHGTGHYPMLERPAEFNVLLKETIEELIVD